MRVRSEEPEDVEGIVDVDLAAFPTPAEAHLINGASRIMQPSMRCSAGGARAAEGGDRSES
jgi:hypothetical protein